MSDKPIQTPKGSATDRISKRYSYEHHLDVNFKNQELPAEILDWSAHGIQIFVDAPLDDQTGYQAEFHIYRTSFVSDEEFENEENIPPVEEWSREGIVRWVRQKSNGVAIGIGFQESLSELPLPDLSEYITDGDLCHLRIFLK